MLHIGVLVRNIIVIEKYSNTMEYWNHKKDISTNMIQENN